MTCMIMTEQETMISAETEDAQPSPLQLLPNGMGELVTCNTEESKYCRGEKISSILPPPLIGKNLSANNMFFCIKDCIVDMAMFTALAKLLSLKNYNFIPQKLSAIQHVYY